MRYKFYLSAFKLSQFLTRMFRFILSNIPMRLRGMEIGASTYIPVRKSITWPHKMRIGNRCEINEGLVLREYSPGTGNNITVDLGSDNYLDFDVKFIVCTQRAKIIMGNNNFIGAGSMLCARLKIVIGSDCQLAAGCSLFDFNHGTKIGGGPMVAQECDEAAITLGDDVWLGSGVTVLKGVTIGTGAVVGAGSVVTKSIPSYEVWAGVPAMKIGDRK